MKKKERNHFLRYFLAALIITGFAMTACNDPEPDPAVTPPLTGTVSISGTAAIGETLTANTVSLGGTGTISYQWKRGGTDDGEAVNIGTNSNTYKVQAADDRCTITVTVTRSGYTGSVSSEPVTVLPKLTGTVSISGTVKTGETLTADTDSLGGDGDISYQWKRVGTGVAAVNVGEDSETYVIQGADGGCTITVTVTRAGYSGTVTSEPTAEVTASQLTGTVTIEGNAWVGHTLTANTDLLNGTGEFTYQWKRGGGQSVGSNSPTYTVQNVAVGNTITVTVTCAGFTGSFTSEPTAAVTLPPLTGTVTIEGNGWAGQTLTANTDLLDGTGNITYQWKRGGTLNIGTGKTYVVLAADEGNYITVTANRPGFSVGVVSNAVAIGSEAYRAVVKKVEFTGTTATVDFENLSNKNVYLVKVNRSASTVTAANTGGVQAASFSMSNGGLSSPLPGDGPLLRRGHPGATALLSATPPPLARETFMPLADPIPRTVGDKKNFLVEQYFTNGNWISREATLAAIGTHSNIWVVNNGIDTTQAKALATKFDLIYPAETSLLGFEYGGGPSGNGGADGDTKIQILVYDIVDASNVSQVAGFYHPKDWSSVEPGSNKAEIFYVDSRETREHAEYVYSTLAHEFQHMIHFNKKYLGNAGTSETWYNEMLSLMTEDVMAGIIDIPTTSQYHPAQANIPLFLDAYNEVGITEWDDFAHSSYSKGYAFGAYLLRNYGGAELLKKILDNNVTNIASITAALNEISPGLTFETALARFGEAMIFSGTSKLEDTYTFDKTVTTTITGYTYTVSAFDIWNMRRHSSVTLGPVVHPLTPMEMRGHSVLLQQAEEWKNKTGNLSITLNRPGNANIDLYLMVR
jgi:predicted RecA/RadA family phage recombinase